MDWAKLLDKYEPRLILISLAMAIVLGVILYQIVVPIPPSMPSSLIVRPSFKEDDNIPPQLSGQVAPALVINLGDLSPEDYEKLGSFVIPGWESLLDTERKQAINELLLGSVADASEFDADDRKRFSEFLLEELVTEDSYVWYQPSPSSSLLAIRWRDFAADRYNVDVLRLWLANNSVIIFDPLLPY